jgi:hypothetical protein
MEILAKREQRDVIICPHDLKKKNELALVLGLCEQ